MASKLAVGDPAPLFSSQLEDESSFRLEDRKGKWTVLYFYPKDDTPGCTKQARTYRDEIHEFQSLQADVFGVSYLVSAKCLTEEFREEILTWEHSGFSVDASSFLQSLNQNVRQLTF